VEVIRVDIDYERQLNQDDNNDNKNQKKEKLILKFRPNIVALLHNRPKHKVMSSQVASHKGSVTNCRAEARTIQPSVLWAAETRITGSCGEWLVQQEHNTV